MSKKYETVKDFFDRGLWKINRVRDAVKIGWITAEEYQQITGEAYESFADHCGAGSHDGNAGTDYRRACNAPC